MESQRSQSNTTINDTSNNIRARYPEYNPNYGIGPILGGLFLNNLQILYLQYSTYRIKKSKNKTSTLSCRWPVEAIFAKTSKFSHAPEVPPRVRAVGKTLQQGNDAMAFAYNVPTKTLTRGQFAVTGTELRVTVEEVGI